MEEHLKKVGASSSPMTAEISQELALRMAALVRDLHADHLKHGAHDYVQDFVARTAEIVAELPKLIDPLLVEARALCLEVVADIEHAGGLKASWDYWYQTYHSGACDKHKDVQRIYARLRELAKARAGEGSV